MKITADVSEIFKTTLLDFVFILSFISEYSILLPRFQYFFLHKMLLTLLTTLLCVNIPERARAFAAAI